MIDAIVVGSGPNGLAAAIVLARAGKRVRVYEAHQVYGGALRSAQLTDNGFVHDIGATVHALGLASPYLRELPLAQHGMHFVHPDAPFAHPLDDGTAVVVERSVDATADNLDSGDGKRYREVMRPLVEQADELMESLLDQRRVRHPLLLARFGMHAIRSIVAFARRFEGSRAPAMLAGVAAHSVLPLENAATTGYALGLIVAAHAFGWPVARGGSQQYANALVNLLQSYGGEVVTGSPIESLTQLPPAKAVLCDVTPRQFLALAGDRLPSLYSRRMRRYRYGPGVYKMDWALHSPVPWRARECSRAGTIHIGGTLEEIARAEREVWRGGHPSKPYVLTVQPSLFDSSRAPDDAHTLWAYCHVPNGSPVHMHDQMESQIERFAPGFRDVIRARSIMTPADLERGNANLVGGDIGGGASDLVQFVTRPVLSLDPHRTPLPNVYICSSSTPPGVGVHGMCGVIAARSALKNSF